MERRLEFRWVGLLSIILASRVLGLFAVFAVFTPYVLRLEDATPWLTGIAFGVYGLVQAVCHMPLGMLSDRWGRKPVMGFGLLCFLVGSVLTVMSHHIATMMVARVLQGMGAIGGVAMAWLVDITQSTSRTKAMAVVGAAMGASFLLAICLGSWLAGMFGLRAVFMVAVVASALGLLLLLYLPATQHSMAAQPFSIRSWWSYRIYYFGVMVQHMVLAANFMVLPIQLQTHYLLAIEQQWRYLCTVFLISFLPLMVWSRWLDRSQHPIRLIRYAILSMMLGQWLLTWSVESVSLWLGFMGLFLSGFNCLEAGLPAMLSRSVTIGHRGQVMGGYSTCQFLGIFFGGLFAGWVIEYWGAIGVYYMSTIILAIWCITWRTADILECSPGGKKQPRCASA